MAVPGAEEDVYLTLLLTDTYLPGALVLAHSLRDARTTKKLGVLITTDSVGAEAITQLKAVYDYVIPVPRIRNAYPANLSLMNRTDLHSAFTKINLWKQTNFRKIVYIDADIVAYRAPDELFDIDHPFSAAPDIGWPDLFNTGVMVLTPSMGEYYALMALAERGISFDGADQGLLNMHFNNNNFNRLSFTYNVTPSAHYQYVPAYRHFSSSINLVHFIGADKPWFQGRYPSTGSSPFDEMVGRWWAVYDRHYRVASPDITPSKPTPELVQYLTKGEYQPRQTQVTHVEHVETTGEPYSEHRHDRSQPHEASHYHHHHHHHHSEHHDGQHHDQHHVASEPGATVQSPEHTAQFPSASFIRSSIEGTEAEARKEQVPEPHHEVPPSPSEQKKSEPHPISFSNWDAQRHPPPADSKPEAANFPATTYEMSRDTAPFVPPERYPSPPRDMWYEVPKERPAPRTEKPKLIFPWEIIQTRPTRVFNDEPSQIDEGETGASNTPTGEQWTSAPLHTQLSAESSITDHSTSTRDRELVTPMTPTIHVTPSDPWTSFTRTNAWDEMPEIERYVDKMQQKHKRSRSLKSPGVIDMPSPNAAVREGEWQRRGSKLTDFPTESERPSLPVTPAPIRRPKFWGGGGPGIGDDEKDDPLLPAAEGVPGQSEWDPVAQLQKLAKQQSEMLLQKLGSGYHDSSDLPPRPVPFGSEALTSPTYVAQSAKVLSPQPVKGSASSSTIRGISSEEEATPRTSSQPIVVATSIAAMTGPIEDASYTGPGAAFEKGEDYPETNETPLLPSEEERDVLET
ncbi:family 8 glycosyl transferase [Xylariales sp. AK1849]|nr:family 8 glycosyl transferase [Xylariales sp. AK1849]